MNTKHSLFAFCNLLTSPQLVTHTQSSQKLDSPTGSAGLGRTVPETTRANCLRTAPCQSRLKKGCSRLEAKRDDLFEQAPRPNDPNQVRGSGEQHFNPNSEEARTLDRLTMQIPWDRPWERHEVNTLLRLGLLSRHAYRVLLHSEHDPLHRALKRRLFEQGFTLHTLKVDNKIWAVMTQRHNEVVLSFRGTGSWIDMINNLWFWPSTNTTIPEEERTHHGMSQLFEKLWPQLHTQLTAIAATQTEPLSLYLCGHSLGGSFAKLTALRLSNQARKDQPTPDLNIELICTFGAPKTLFDKSRQAYCALGLDHRTLSITNHQDIVPELPPEQLTPYVAVGEQLHITRDGALWYRPDPQAVQNDRYGLDRPETDPVSDEDQMKKDYARWIADHNLNSYLIGLNAHYNETLKPVN